MKLIFTLLIITGFIFSSSLIFGQVCTTDNSPNLIPSGDFGQGEANIAADSGSFQTELRFMPDPPPSDGFYTLTNNTSSWGDFASDFWIDIQDNSPDLNGYMMVINQGAVSLIYETQLDLCAGLDYTFAFDAINLYEPAQPGDSLPQLQIWVNNELLADLGPLPKDAQWYRFSGSFQATEGLNNIQIRNASADTSGNDFALDNLSVQLCAPTLLLSQDNEQARCPEDNITLNLDLNQDTLSEIFQVQLSINNEASWTNIGNPSNSTSFNINRIPPNARYRVLAAKDFNQLFEEACRFTSLVYKVNYADPRTCNEVIESVGELCTGSRGDNIFEDGDFGSGSNNIAPNPGLAPGYQYQTNPPPNDGFYTLTNNTATWGSFARDFWVNTRDNSDDPNGYMMVVNASVSPGIFYEKTVPICESTNYEFSADIINMNRPSNGLDAIKPNVSFLINGQEVFETGDVPQDGRWNQYGFTFTTRSGVSAITLTLRNNAPGGLGNDLAIDNISFRPCGPEASLPDTTLLCVKKQAVLLEPELQRDGEFTSIALQWQRSINQGSSWADIPNQTDTVLFLTSPISGDWYRLKLANRPENLGDFTCQFLSDVTILAAQSITALKDTICQGDTLSLAGQDFTNQGLNQIVLAQNEGCDSIIQLELTVFPSFDVQLNQILCTGDTFQFDTDYLTEGGNYPKVLKTVQGCDSLVDLTLMVVPTYERLDTTILCYGEGYEGKIFFEDEVITNYFQTQSGCDSTMSSYFKILPSQNQRFVELVCPGETFNGNVVNQDTLVSVGGFNGVTCDSVTLYELQLFQDPPPEIIGDTLLCKAESTTLSVPGFASYEWSTGDTFPNIEVNQSGTFQVNLRSENNCLYQDTFSVEQINLDAEISLQDVACFGNQDGLVDISSITGVVTGTKIFLNGEDQNGQRRLSDLAAGSYELVIEEPRGCRFETTFEIGAPDPFEVLLLPEDQTINLGDSITLTAFGNRAIQSITWSPAEALSCIDCLEPTARPVNTTRFEVLATDSAGCQTNGSLLITVDKTLTFYAPNAFSPNNDGINDAFTLFASSTVQEIKHLQILDRWGNLIKEAQNIAPGSAELEWDGFYRGKTANPGIYLWKAAVRFKDGQVLTFAGDLLLIR